MNSLYLLGAGSSVEAGIPDSYGLTKSMLNHFDSKPHMEKSNQILKFVTGGLLFQSGVFGNNPLTGVNIEDLFNAIILLSEKDSSVLNPFVSSWHPLLNSLEIGKIPSSVLSEFLKEIFLSLKNSFRPNYFNNSFITIREIENVLGNLSTFPDVGYGLENSIKNIISSAIGQRGGEEFSEVSKEMLEALRNLVWVEEKEKICYLQPLIKKCIEDNSYIVSLNYDNSIELVSDLMGVKIDTGFENWSKTGEFENYDGDIKLIKLHGSIDWALIDKRPTNEKPINFQVIEKVDVKAQKPYNPAIIFGGKNKLTTKGPFLSLLRIFEKQLKIAENLIIIGYSFGDEHVNELIKNWINNNINNQLLIINPNFSFLSNGFSKHLLKLDKQRITIIEENTSKAILKL